MEVLVVGPERPPRRWPLVLLALLLALTGAAAVVDGRARAREVDRLIAYVEEGQGAVAYADKRVSAMVTYASPALWSQSTAPGIRASLERIVAEAAGDGSVRLGELATDVADLRVLPWHGSVAAARDRYAAHLAGRAAYLERVESDPGALFDGDAERGLSVADVRSAFLEVVDASERARVDELVPPP